MKYNSAMTNSAELIKKIILKNFLNSSCSKSIKKRYDITAAAIADSAILIVIMFNLIPSIYTFVILL